MTQQAQIQGPQQGGRSDITLPVIAVAAVLIVALAGLMIVLVVNPSSNDLRADLDSYVLGESGVVFVSVYGEITNTGEQSVSGLVTIRVWDGSGWQTFTESTDLIQPQDSTEFAWVHFFEDADASEFQIEWSVDEA